MIGVDVDTGMMIMDQMMDELMTYEDEIPSLEDFQAYFGEEYPNVQFT
jgi:hypothetical protein